MNLSKIQLAILGLIIANIIWGAGFPIYKWTLEVIPPFTFVFIRFFGGALIIFPFVYKSLKIARDDIPKLILTSILGVSISIPLLFFGLQLSPSINAPIILSFGPILLIFGSVIFLSERLKVKVLAGTLISLLGIITIILRPFIELGGLSVSVLGSLLIFGATISIVSSVLILKKITKNNNPLTITFWMFIIGVIPLVPFVIYEAQSFNFINEINLQGLFGIFYGIVFAAAIAHFLYAYGLKYIKASEVGIFSYVDPIVTVAIALPLLGEIITPAYLVGALLVFLGIFIAENRIHYHPIHMLRSK